VICGSLTLGRLFDFISAHFWLNGALYFSLKNLFCGKNLLISVRFFFLKESIVWAAICMLEQFQQFLILTQTVSFYLTL
jgi:hypothetical protein